uniref:Uncharacterized protein n=1 Tax=Oryza rufipogon TaxID=4529 RepID=A0A0E0QDW8_ORYRU
MSGVWSNIQRSFESGKAHAEGEYQARRAVEAVTDAAGAIHIPFKIFTTGEQVAQAAQNAATATKGSAVQAGIHPRDGTIQAKLRSTQPSR